MSGDPEQSKKSTSTLTRKGPFSPQWLQNTPATGGVPITGFSRSRPGADSDKQPDSARRFRSESFSGSDSLKQRTSKWAPDDRDTWKTRERWANGPDSSRRWTEVQSAGRQKQGLVPGDALSRWNTDGGRWTEDRRSVDDKDYIPKNSRWNDEERGDWRSSPGKGELAMGRGRGGRGASRRSPTRLNGVHRPGDTRIRYSKRRMKEIMGHMRDTMGSRLTLPTGIDTSRQEIFRSPSPNPDETVQKPEDDAPTSESEKVPEAIISPEEIEADSWVYKDPTGQVQGPFSKLEVLEWYNEGYFSEDLPVQSQISATENWMPLSKLLEVWKVPMRTSNEINIPTSKSARSLDKLDSLPTIGSNIPMPLEAEQGVKPAQGISDLHSMFQSIPQQNQAQVSDLNQAMQNLLRQKQSQGGLPFGNAMNAPGLTQLRSNQPFQQTNPYLNTYGLQQRPTGLQDNALVNSGLFEALQNLNAQQAQRNQLQSNPYGGFDLSSQMGNPLQNQFQGNVNLAALLNQAQMNQRTQDLRNVSDLQRLFQQRNLQQGGAYGGLGNALSGGIRSPYMQQAQPNPWNNQVQGGYNALNSLLQRPQQQLNQQRQQQLTQAMLLNRLNAMRYPNQQLGMNRPSQRDLISLAALQSGDSSLLEQMAQQRQRNNLSPQAAAFHPGMDHGFQFAGQTSSGLPLSQPGNPVQKNTPFPQHILHQLTGKQEMGMSSGMESVVQTQGLDLGEMRGISEEEVGSAKDKPPAKTNAWGVTPTSAASTSLLQIQEEESKTPQQTAAVKPSPTPLATQSGWNVQHVKPTSLVDIMQEDARQAEIKSSAQPAKQKSVWSKKGSEGSARQDQKERSSKEDHEDGGLRKSNVVAKDGKKTGDGSQESEVHLFSGQLKISHQFREWCKDKMIELGGSGDITLIEFLLSLKSRSEIAEYIQEYFKDANPDKLSVFISGFMKRKDSDAAQIKKERGGQKSKKKSKAKSSNSSVELESASTDSVGPETGVSAKTARAKPKQKAKKQPKGQHLPADMLGFKSNVNFDSLYRGNSNG